MEIKPLDSAAQIAAQTPSYQQEQQKTGTAATRPAAAGIQDQVKVTGNASVNKSLKIMENLRAVSEEINAYAKVVRHTDSVLEKASNQVELMKKPLETIVKNYPPFPPGSEKRVELLKSYASLRKEIDKLTVPPPDDVSTPALKRMFSDLFDNDGKFNASDALGLPQEIPPETTDHQILSVMEKLDTAKMQIDRGRVELSSSIK